MPDQDNQPLKKRMEESPRDPIDNEIFDCI